MKSLLRSFTSSLLSVGLIALFVQGAFAHTYLSSINVGGTALAEGDCVRPHPSTGFDSPISLVSSADMTCGFLPYSAQPANRACPIAAGASMSVQWHHNSAASTDDILDPTHKGPIMIYLAKSSTGAGNVWFKIWQDGYDPSTGLWATDRMIAAKGLTTFTIPSDIAPGNYLMRAELIALHGANVLDGVQPYVGCAELTISGSGSANPAGVAFPGAYKDTDPGLFFNLYAPFTSYPIPGPAVYVPGKSSSGPATSAPATSKPSNPVTSAPATSKPATPAPTKKPSKPATPAPTKKPAPTTKPSKPATAAPTTNPSNPSSTPITIALNGGSSAWWLGVQVSGGSQAVTKVEIMDSGSVKSWTALDNLGYAYVFGQSIQLTLPISVRLTASNGQVTLSNVFTSFSVTPVNTGKDFSSTASNHGESTPVTTPEGPGAAAPVSVKTLTGTNKYWIGVAVEGVENIASVEVMDSAALASYAFMTSADWGFFLGATSEPFATPFNIRVTDETGAAVTATVESFAAGAVINA